MPGFNPSLLGNSLEMPWPDIRLVLDLFLGGLGVGAFLVAVIASYFDKEKYENIIKTGAYLSPIAVIIGLILLVSELKQPQRFITTFWNTNPTSVLSWGVFLQSIFVLIALIYAWLVYSGSSGKLVGGLGILFAVIVGGYHGLLLSAAQTRDLWNAALVPALFMATAVATGIAAVVILASLFAGTSDISSAVSKLNKAQGVTLSIILFLIIVYLITLFNSSPDAQVAARLLVTGSFGLIFWIGAVVIGLLLPLLIEAYDIYSTAGGEAAAAATVPLLISVLVLIGGFVLRYVIVFAGQSLPLQ